jgi:hypothetical protein
MKVIWKFLDLRVQEILSLGWFFIFNVNISILAYLTMDNYNFLVHGLLLLELQIIL